MLKALFLASVLVAVVVQASPRSRTEVAGRKRYDVVAKNVVVKAMTEVDRLINIAIQDDLKIPFLNEVLGIVLKTVRRVRKMHDGIPHIIRDLLDRAVDGVVNIVMRIARTIYRKLRAIVTRVKGFIFA